MAKDPLNFNKLKKKGTCFVMGGYRRSTSLSELVVSLSWHTLEQRRLLSQASFFDKIHIHIQLRRSLFIKQGLLDLTVVPINMFSRVCSVYCAEQQTNSL